MSRTMLPDNLRAGGYFVMPQIGPHPVASETEKEKVLRAGFQLIRADNYLVAKKMSGHAKTSVQK